MVSKYANVPGKGNGPKKPKIFVLDTNIILHDYKAIRKFQDNDIVVPVAVLEELDKFKKGTDALSYNARGFMRDIDRLTEGRMFGKEGVPIGKGLGDIKIEPNHPFPDSLKDLFHDDIQDHRILATAIWVRDHNPDRFVALVTKDINLRMKSKAVGMVAQDYLTDRVEEAKVETSQKEVHFIDNAPAEVLQELAYSQNNAVDWRAVCHDRPYPNQLFKFKVQNDEILCARYDADIDKILLVRKREACGIKPRYDEL